MKGFSVAESGCCLRRLLAPVNSGSYFRLFPYVENVSAVS